MPAQNLINNHFLLRQLAEEINQKAKGFYLYETYSLNKKEVALLFRFKDERFYLQVYLGEEAFVTLPEYPRHQKNEIPLFEELLNLPLEAAYSPDHDRSLALNFGESTLLLKLHGRNGNMIFFHGEEPRELFRESFVKDKELPLSTYRQEVEKGTLPPSLPKMIADLVRIGQTSLQNAMSYLESPSYYVYREEQRVFLSYYEEDGELLLRTDNPADAVNGYAAHFFRTERFHSRKRNVLGRLRSRLDMLRSSIKAGEKHLEELERSKNYKTQADLIMANLHRWPERAEELEVEDFYTGLPRVLKIKPGLSPQKTAEKLYRKSRSQEQERERTLQKIIELEEEREKVKAQLAVTEEAAKPQELNPLEESALVSRQEKAPLPYRAYRFGEAEIWVGKGARQNDELTFSHAHKEDIWLHAHGVSGSHVILRRKKNQETQLELLEKAAQLAAWHSKARGTGLCPVIYTLRKYVKKPRGGTPGQVIHEREKSLLVVPANFPEAIV